MAKEKQQKTGKHESKHEILSHSPALGSGIRPEELTRLPSGSDIVSKAVAGFSSGTELTEGQVVTLARTMFPKE